MGRRAGARPAFHAGTVVLMRVKVDGSKCQGHNRCIQTAPELFDADNFGYSHPRDKGVVPPELVEKARLAVKNCPERAVSIVEVED